VVVQQVIERRKKPPPLEAIAFRGEFPKKASGHECRDSFLLTFCGSRN
jgi:hypothetical protein